MIIQKKNNCLNIFKNHIIQENYPDWVVCGSDHSKDGISFYNSIIPFYNPKIYLGKNTISSPSVLCIKNNKTIFFDEKFTWLLDVVFYQECYLRFGDPLVIKDIIVTNGDGLNRLHDIIEKKQKKEEVINSIKKFNYGLKMKLLLINYNIKYVISKILF